MHEHVVILRAPSDRALHLWFEPWAEGLAFPAGSEIELRATSSSPGKLELEESTERTAVYSWPGSTLSVISGGAIVTSFDLPVPEGLTRDKVSLLFGSPPVPTSAEQAAANRKWWKLW